MIISKLKFSFIICFSIVLLTSCSTLSNLDIQKLNYKANELMSAGNIDGAIARLESINDLNPGFPQTHYNLGVAYHKKGDYQKAVDELNKAISLKNNFSEAYYTLGVINEELALAEIDKSKTKQKSDNTEIILSYFNFSKSNFNKYIELSPSAEDADSVKSKIESLDTDIEKYQKMLDGQTVNQAKD